MKDKLHSWKAWLKQACVKKLAFVVVVCLASAGITMAYLTYRMQIINQILTGSNTISITEEFEPPQKQDVGDNIFKKKIQIENIDQTDSFIRVFMDFSDSSIKNIAQITPDGKHWYEASKYLSSDGSNLPENWVYISEADDVLLGGYYYYTIPIKAKEKTTPLSECIMVTYSDVSQIRDFDILVMADSIQTYINEENADGTFTAKDVSEETDGWKIAWTEYMERR
ncbi:MAG: hypothetical protein Q4C66_02475 [Lachnospiraceae bacterium]|nr:hypothetical protein [Lachnospiraceae bacterium]